MLAAGHQLEVYAMNAFDDVRFVVLVPVLCGGIAVGCDLDDQEELGAQIFNDTGLSLNENQSCASCHSRDTGGTGADSTLNAHGAVYEGSVSGRFGNRKPPASAYATLAPVLDYDQDLGFVGGNFWDGRATGWRLGSPAAEQAQGPFLNPVEQAVPDAAAVVERVCDGSYGDLFRSVWGEEGCADVDQGYLNVALSITAFEDSDRVNQFGSKYDAVLQHRARLSAQEAEGLALFEGSAQCAGCHVASSSGTAPLFTDFGFDNLGVPKNPENPFYGMDDVLVGGAPVNPLGEDWIDPGLEGFLATLLQDSAWRTLPYVPDSMLEMSDESLAELATESYGKHRVPTLRNVDKRPHSSFVKAYGHNGYFKSLKGIVHFYNTRDTLQQCEGAYTEAEALAANCWPPPEVAENLNTSVVGDLGLDCEQEDAIVAFLGALSDGWKP
jgi:cytochrome c peroxidase